HANALRAIRSPSTAIVDYKEVCAAMTRELTARGVTIETGARVTAIKRRAGAIELVTPRAVVRTTRIVNCAGLYSDVVARMAGARVDVRIIPFRGEYYMIRPERQDIVRGLIYPVPDPEFPFLGVHLTRTVHGEVEAGPNAGRRGCPRAGREPGRLTGRRLSHRRRGRRDSRVERAVSRRHGLAGDRSSYRGPCRRDLRIEIIRGALRIYSRASATQITPASPTEAPASRGASRASPSHRPPMNAETRTDSSREATTY